MKIISFMKCLPFIGMYILLILGFSPCSSKTIFDDNVKPADTRPADYCGHLKGRKVALIINQTSKIGDTSLLDMLLTRGINVVKIFVPEHGFRGKGDAGAHIDNMIDSATHLPVISLYGSPLPMTLAMWM